MAEVSLVAAITSQCDFRKVAHDIPLRRWGTGSMPCSFRTRAIVDRLTEAEPAFYDAMEVNDSAVEVLGDKKLRAIAQRPSSAALLRRRTCAHIVCSAESGADHDERLSQW